MFSRIIQGAITGKGQITKRYSHLNPQELVFPLNEKSSTSKFATSKPQGKVAGYNFYQILCHLRKTKVVDILAIHWLITEL